MIPNAECKVLYVLPRFPVPSETFVVDEVMGIRARNRLAGVIGLVSPSDTHVRNLSDDALSTMEYTNYLDRIPLPCSMAEVQYLLSREAQHSNSQISSCATHKSSSFVRALRATKIAAMAIKYKADLIYAHWPRPTEVALIASRLSKVPFAFSVHAHEVEHDHGHLSIAAAAAEFVAFCNKAALDKMTDVAAPVPTSKLRLIYHGVDIDRFVSRSSPPEDGSLHLSTAGRLTQTKGFDRAIEAVKFARAQGLDVKLSIVGDGPMRAPLERQAKQLGKDIVQFTGWLSRQALIQTIATSHAFMLLADTNYHDGLPNVVLEAMAIGRLPILSPLPAAAEAVVDGKNGFVLDSTTDWTSFCEICRLLIENPTKGAELGMYASDSVRSQHNRSVQLDLLANTFDSVVARRTK